MPQCIATTQHDNRGHGGRQCRRDAVRGSEFCFSHGGVQKSSTPEEIRARGLGVECTARVAETGEPCGNYAIQGGTVCRMHGGSAPQTKQAAVTRMMELRLRAIGVIEGQIDDPALDPAVRQRAAVIVLDRTGFGPSSKIEHEHEVKPYERVIAEATVVRDIALPPGESDQIIEAEVEDEPTPTEPAKDSPAGKPRFDPTTDYAAERKAREADEVARAVLESHKVVAFPTPPRNLR